MPTASGALGGNAYISQCKVPIAVEEIEQRKNQRGWNQKQRGWNHQQTRKELQPVEQPPREKTEIAAHRFDAPFAEGGPVKQILDAVARVAKIVVRRLVHF